MKRGDLIVVALPGDFGKPRPAVVVQSNDIDVDSVLVCLFTSDQAASANYRQAVEPDTQNGLRELSYVMTDKVQAARKDKCGTVIGRLSNEDMQILNENLTFVLGLGD